MSDEIPRVRQVLNAMFEKRATQDEAMRAVLEHDAWQMPLELYTAASAHDKPVVVPRIVMYGEKLNANPGDVYLFSDDASARRAATHLGSVAAGLSGVEALRRALAVGQRLVVNPGSPNPDTLVLPLSDEGRGLLALWMQAVDLEQRAARSLEDPETLAALRAFGGYLTYFHSATNSVVTIPKQLGLENGAVLFTSPDNVAAFLAKLTDEVKAGLVRVPTDGATWFSLVVKGGGVDGILLNPLGPAPVVAIPLEVCRKVAELTS